MNYKRRLTKIREDNRHKERQTDTRKDKQTKGKTNRQKERQIDKRKDKQTKRKTNRQKERQTDKRKERKKERKKETFNVIADNI